MAEHLPAHGKQGINSLFCIAGAHSICFLMKLSLTQEFSSIYPADPLPNPTGVAVDEHLSGAELLAGVKPQQLLLTALCWAKLHSKEGQYKN